MKNFKVKKLLSLALVMLMLVGMMPVGALAEGEEAPHEHSGGAASCTAPGVCVSCSQPYLEPTGHSGGAASCTAPGVCVSCGTPYINATGHSGGVATCTAQAVCGVCNQPYGEKLPHVPASEASCTAQAVCGVCNQPYGELAAHVPASEASCTAQAVCSVCNQPYGELASHVPASEASCTAQAVCGVCNQPYGEKLPHSFNEEGQCGCGATETDEPGTDDEEELPPDDNSAPTCTCDTDDAEYHAPFCALYVRTYEPCFCQFSCAEEGLNEWCEHCYFEGAAACAYKDEDGDSSRTYEGVLTVSDISFDIILGSGNNTQTKNVVITNTSDTEIIITSVTINENEYFALTGGNASTIAAGQSDNSYELTVTIPDNPDQSKLSTGIIVSYGEGRPAEAVASVNIQQQQYIDLVITKVPTFGMLQSSNDFDTAYFTITNNGNIPAQITGLTLSPLEGGDIYFEVIKGDPIVEPGGTNSSWGVKPKADLPAGVYNNSFSFTHTPANLHGFNTLGGLFSLLSFTVYNEATEPNLTLISPFIQFEAGGTPQVGNISITNTGGETTITDTTISDCSVMTDSGETALANPPFTVETVTSVQTGTTSMQVTPNSDLTPGTYKGTVTVTYGSGKTASTLIVIHVTAPLPALTASGTGAASGKYGDKLSDLTITGLTAKHGDSDVPGTWAFVDGDTVPKAGEEAFTAKFTPASDADNYKELTAEVAVTIEKYPVTITGASSTKVYNGGTLATIDLSSASITGLPEGYTASLPDSVSGTLAGNGQPPKQSFESFDLSGISITNRQNEDVTGCFDISLDAGLKCSITPRVVKLSGIAVQEKVYDGTQTAQCTSTDVKAEGLLNGCSITINSLKVAFDGADAGTRPVKIVSIDYTITDGGSGNFEYTTDHYTVVLDESVTGTIKPLPVVVTPVKGQSKTYGSADPELSFTTDKTGSFVMPTLSRAEGDDVGQYAYSLDTSKTSTNYSFSLAEDADKFAITPLVFDDTNITLVVSDKTYTGAPVVGVDMIDNSTGVADLKDGVHFTITGASATGIGTYTATLKGMGNCSGSVSAEWKVNPPAIINQVINDQIDPATATLETLEQLRLLQAALDTVTASTVATDAEKQQWSDAAAKVPGLTEKIAERFAEVDTLMDSVRAVNNIKPDNVTAGDRAALEKALAAIGTLRKDHAAAVADADTQAMLNAAEDRIEACLDTLDDTQDEIDKIQAWIDKNKNKVSAGNSALITEYENIIKEIAALDDNSERIVLSAVGSQLESIRSGLYGYRLIEGIGGSYLKGSPKGLAFKSNGDIAKFNYLLIDSCEVPGNCYAAYAGSTIVTLNPMFLNSLYPGWHTIQFVYTDGDTDVGYFVVYDPYYVNAPRTGDEMNPGLWLALMVMGIGGAAATLSRMRRRKEDG